MFSSDLYVHMCAHTHTHKTILQSILCCMQNAFWVSYKMIILKLLLCVVFMYIYVLTIWVYLVVSMCTWICDRDSRVFSAFLCFSSLRHGLSENPSLSILARLAGQSSSGWHDSGFTSTCAHIWLLWDCWGFRLSYSCLHRQWGCSLSHLPSPKEP